MSPARQKNDNSRIVRLKSDLVFFAAGKDLDFTALYQNHNNCLFSLFDVPSADSWLHTDTFHDGTKQI